jgi:hypothetical protein
MDTFEKEFLKLCGYNPESTQACRDYTAKLISQSQMWKILNKNIHITIDHVSESATPRKGDVVRKWGNNLEFVYGRINWVDRGNDSVCVYWFLDKDVESFNLDDFAEYLSRGGRTTWILPDD